MFIHSACDLGSDFRKQKKESIVNGTLQRTSKAVLCDVFSIKMMAAAGNTAGKKKGITG